MRQRSEKTSAVWVIGGLIGAFVIIGVFVGVFVGTGAYSAQQNTVDGVFQIFCPADYVGNLEDSIVSIFSARALTIGLGCNGREPAVTMSRIGDPSFVSKKGIHNTKLESNNNKLEKGPNKKRGNEETPKGGVKNNNVKRSNSVITITSPTVVVPPILTPIDPDNPVMPSRRYHPKRVLKQNTQRCKRIKDARECKKREQTQLRGCKRNSLRRGGGYKKSVIMFPQNGLVQDDHFTYPLVTGDRTEDEILYSTGDVSFDKNEGIFSVLNDQELLLLSYPHRTMIDLFQGSACEQASSESMIRYDNEAQRFVMTAIDANRTTICIAVASSSNATDTYYMYEFHSSILHISNWYFSVWGDYYNACWINNATTQMCAVFQRSLMLGSMGSPTVVIVTDIFSSSTTSPPISLYQDKSTRGLTVVSASCGVFMSLNPTPGNEATRSACGFHFCWPRLRRGHLI